MDDQIGFKSRELKEQGVGDACSGSGNGRTRKEAHPTGVKVSMPLAAAQGRPLDFAASWTFLAVMSTARTDENEKMG